MEVGQGSKHHWLCASVSRARSNRAGKRADRVPVCNEPDSTGSPTDEPDLSWSACACARAVMFANMRDFDGTDMVGVMERAVSVDCQVV